MKPDQFCELLRELELSDESAANILGLPVKSIQIYKNKGGGNHLDWACKGLSSAVKRQKSLEQSRKYMESRRIARTTEDRSFSVAYYYSYRRERWLLLSCENVSDGLAVVKREVNTTGSLCEERKLLLRDPDNLTILGPDEAAAFAMKWRKHPWAQSYLRQRRIAFVPPQPAPVRPNKAERENQVIKLREEDKLTYKAIAERLNVSTERVRQIYFHAARRRDSARKAALKAAEAEPIKVSQDQQPWRYVDLPVRAKNIIINLGLVKLPDGRFIGEEDLYNPDVIADLAKKLTRIELLRTPNCGRKSVNDIEDWLSANGYSLQNGRYAWEI